MVHIEGAENTLRVSVPTRWNAGKPFPKSDSVLGVQVEQRGVLPLVSLEQPRPVVRTFTTLNDNQDRALFHFLVRMKDKSGWHSAVGIVSGYSLKDPSIQAYAKFLLTQAVELGVNPEDFLTNARNSKKESNLHSANILTHLYIKGKTRVDELGRAVNLSHVSTFEHLRSLEEKGFVKNTRFPWAEQHYSFSWVKGKKISGINFGLIKQRDYHSSIKKIAGLLKTTKKEYDYAELQELTSYSRTTNQTAIRELEKQGLVDRTSSRIYAHAALKKKGRLVTEKIILPLIKAHRKQARLIAEPTQEHLAEAMRMYKQSKNL